MRQSAAAVLAALRDDAGASLAEYGLIAALLGIVMIGAFATFKNGANTRLTNDAAGWVSLTVSPP